MNLNLETPLGEWESDDAIALRSFILSDTGRKAFQRVSEACPELLDGSDVNTTLVRSGEVKGFTSALEILFSLVHIKPADETVPPNYPDLDNDAAWPSQNNL
jgi:hypothetical protein